MLFSSKERRFTKLQRQEAITGYTFLLPNFIGFLIFTAIPIVLGFIISFTNYTGFPGASFVGFENYSKLFRDSQFKAALINNLIYSAVSVPLTVVIALAMALLLNKPIFLGEFFKTVYFFPNLTSMVAIGAVAMMLFEPVNGPINSLLRSINIPENNIPQWFYSTSSALATVIIVVVWKQVGYYMIMFLAGLKNIPAHLYDAAKIDGANSWQLFWNVTFPMLSPTTFMVTILTFIGSFQVFDIINVTTQGGPGRSTSVLVFRIYTEAFSNWKMGYGSAMAYFLFLIIFIISLFQWKIQKNWVVADY